MKQIFYVLLLLLLISCSTSKESEVQLDENKNKSDVEVTEHKEQPVTVDLQGKEVWEVYDTEEIIFEREKVFMFSDAEKIENKVLQEFEKDYDDDSWVEWGNYLFKFHEQTTVGNSEYTDYFNKLSDLREVVIIEKDKEKAIKMLKEAKKIREEIEKDVK